MCFAGSLAYTFKSNESATRVDSCMVFFCTAVQLRPVPHFKILAPIRALLFCVELNEQTTLLVWRR